MAVEELKVSQERQMVEMNMQLEAQGKKISLITYVTLLCLPLATLSQVRQWPPFLSHAVANPQGSISRYHTTKGR